MSEIQTENSLKLSVLGNFEASIIDNDNVIRLGKSSADWELALFDVNQIIELINDPSFLKKYGLQKLCQEMEAAHKSYWTTNQHALNQLKIIGNTEEIKESQYNELRSIVKEFAKANQHLAYYQDLVEAHKNFVDKTSTYNTLALEMPNQESYSPEYDSAIEVYQLTNALNALNNEYFKNHANGALHYLQQVLYGNLSKALEKLELVAKLERPSIRTGWLNIKLDIKKFKFKLDYDFGVSWVKVNRAKEQLYQARIGQIRHCKELLAKNKESLAFVKYDRANKYLASMPDFSIIPSSAPVKLLPQFCEDTKEFVEQIATPEINNYLNKFAKRHASFFGAKTKFFIEQGAKVYAQEYALAKRTDGGRTERGIELAKKYFIQNSICDRNAFEIGVALVKTSPGKYPRLKDQIDQIQSISTEARDQIISLGREELKKEMELATQGFRVIIKASITDLEAYNSGRKIVSAKPDAYSQLSSQLLNKDISAADRQAFITLGRENLAKFQAIKAGLDIKESKIFITNNLSPAKEVNCQYLLTPEEYSLLTDKSLRSSIAEALTSGVTGLSRIANVDAQLEDNAVATNVRALSQLLEKLGSQALGTKILEEDPNRKNEVIRQGQGAAVARAEKEWVTSDEAKRLNELFELKRKSETRFKLNSLLISLGKHFVDKKITNDTADPKETLDKLQARRVSYVDAMKQLYPGSLSENDEKLLKALLKNEIKKTHLGKALTDDQGRIVGYENLQALFALFPQVVHEHYKNLDIPNDRTFIHYILKEQLDYTLITYLDKTYFFGYDRELTSLNEHQQACEQVEKIGLYHQIFNVYFSKFYQSSDLSNSRDEARTKLGELFQVDVGRELSYSPRRIFHHLKYLIQLDGDIISIGKKCQKYIDSYLGNNADYGKLICIIDKFYNMDKVSPKAKISDGTEEVEVVIAPDLVLDYGKRHIDFLLENHFANCQGNSDEFLSWTTLDERGIYYSSSLDSHLQYKLAEYIADADIEWNLTAQNFIDKFGDSENQEAYRVKGFKHYLSKEDKTASEAFVNTLQKEVIHTLDGHPISTRPAITEKNFVSITTENNPHHPKRLADIEATVDKEIVETSNFYNLHCLVAPFIPTRRYQVRLAHVKAIIGSDKLQDEEAKEAKSLVDFLQKRESAAKSKVKEIKSKTENENDSPERKQLFSKTADEAKTKTADEAKIVTYDQIPIFNDIFADFELKAENAKGIEKFFMDLQSLKDIDPAALDITLQNNLVTLARTRRAEVLAYFTSHANDLNSAWSLTIQILAHNTGIDEVSKLYFLKGLSQTLNYQGEGAFKKANQWCNDLLNTGYLGFSQEFIKEKSWEEDVQRTINAYLNEQPCTQAVFKIVDTFGTNNNRQYYWSQRVIQLFTEPNASFWGGEFQYYETKLLPKVQVGSIVGTNDTSTQTLASMFFGDNNVQADSPVLKKVSEYVNNLYQVIVDNPEDKEHCKRYIPDNTDFDRLNSPAEKLLELFSKTSVFNTVPNVQEQYSKIKSIREKRAAIKIQCENVVSILMQLPLAKGAEFKTIDDVIAKINTLSDQIKRSEESIAESSSGPDRATLKDENNEKQALLSQIKKTIIETVHKAMASIANDYLKVQPRANSQKYYEHWSYIKDKFSWDKELEASLSLDVTDWISNTVEVFYGSSFLSSLNSIESIVLFLLKKNTSDETTQAVAKSLKAKETEISDLFRPYENTVEGQQLKADIDFLMKYPECKDKFISLWSDVLEALEKNPTELSAKMSELKLLLPILKGFLRFSPQESKVKLAKDTQELLKKLGQNTAVVSEKAKTWLQDCVDLFEGRKIFDESSKELFETSTTDLAGFGDKYQNLINNVIPAFSKKDAINLKPEWFQSIVTWGSVSLRNSLKKQFFEAQEKSENIFAEALYTLIAYTLDGTVVTQEVWNNAIKNYNDYTSLSRKIERYSVLSKHDQDSQKLIKELRRTSKYIMLFKNYDGKFDYENSKYDDFISAKELLDLAKEIPMRTMELANQLPKNSPGLIALSEIQDKYRSVLTSVSAWETDFNNEIKKILENTPRDKVVSENLNTVPLDSVKRSLITPNSSMRNFNSQSRSDSFSSPHVSMKFDMLNSSLVFGSDITKNLSNHSLLQLVCVILGVKDLSSLNDDFKKLSNKEVFVKASQILDQCPQMVMFRRTYVSNSLDALKADLSSIKGSPKTESLVTILQKFENEIESIEKWAGLLNGSDDRLKFIVSQIADIYCENCKIDYWHSDNSLIQPFLARLTQLPAAKEVLLEKFCSLHEYYYPFDSKAFSAKDFPAKVDILETIEKQLLALAQGNRQAIRKYFKRIQEHNYKTITNSANSSPKKNTSLNNSTKRFSIRGSSSKGFLLNSAKSFAEKDAIRIYEGLGIDVGITAEQFLTLEAGNSNPFSEASSFLAMLYSAETVKKLTVVPHLIPHLYFNVFDDAGRDLFIKDCTEIVKAALKNPADYREFARVINFKLDEFELVSQLKIEVIVDQQTLIAEIVRVVDEVKNINQIKVQKIADDLGKLLIKTANENIKLEEVDKINSAIKQDAVIYEYCDQKTRPQLSQLIVKYCNNKFENTRFADLMPLTPELFAGAQVLIERIHSLRSKVNLLAFSVYDDDSKTVFLNKCLSSTSPLKTPEAIKEFVKQFNFTAQYYCDQQLSLANITDVVSLDNELKRLATTIADERARELTQFVDNVSAKLVSIAKSEIEGSALKVEELYSYMMTFKGRIEKACSQEQANQIAQKLRIWINIRLTQAGSPILDEQVNTFEKLVMALDIRAGQIKPENLIISNILGSLPAFLGKLTDFAPKIAANIESLISSYKTIQGTDLSIKQAKELAIEINILLGKLRCSEGMKYRIDVSKVTNTANLTLAIQRIANNFSSSSPVTRAIQVSPIVQSYNERNIVDKFKILELIGFREKIEDEIKELEKSKVILTESEFKEAKTKLDVALENAKIEESRFIDVYNLLTPAEFQLAKLGLVSVRIQLETMMDVKVVKSKIPMVSLMNKANDFVDLENKVSVAVDEVDISNLQIGNITNTKAIIKDQFVQQIKAYKDLDLGKQAECFIREVLTKISSKMGEDSYRSLQTTFSDLIKNTIHMGVKLKLESVEQEKALVDLLHKSVVKNAPEIEFPKGMTSNGLESYFKMVEAASITVGAARGCALIIEQKLGVHQNRFFYMLDSFAGQMTPSNAVQLLTLFATSYNQNVHDVSKLSEDEIKTIIPNQDSNNNNEVAPDVKTQLDKLKKLMQNKLEEALEVKQIKDPVKTSSSSDPGFWSKKSKVAVKPRSSSINDITKEKDLQQPKDFSISAVRSR